MTPNDSTVTSSPNEKESSTCLLTEVIHFFHFIGSTFCRLCPSRELYYRSKITQKKLKFLLGSMMFHVRSTDMENVTSYIYNLSDIMLQCYTNLYMMIMMYIYTRAVCVQCFGSSLHSCESRRHFGRSIATGCRGYWGPSGRDVGRRNSHQTGGPRCRRCWVFVRKFLAIFGGQDCQDVFLGGNFYLHVFDKNIWQKGIINESRFVNIDKPISTCLRTILVF